MVIILMTYGSDVAAIITRVDLLFFPIVLLISILQYALSAWRWSYIASKTQSSIKYTDAIRYYYIAGFLNNILPTGIIGDIYRTFNIKVNNQQSGNIIKSLQSVIFERLSGQIALGITFIISLEIYFIVNEKYLASLYIFSFIIFCNYLT